MEIAGALEMLGPDAAPARHVGIGHKTGPIFITIDPERDTPDVRRNTPRRTIHASSDLPAVRNRSRLLSRPVAPTALRKTEAGDEDDLVDHGTYLYIMDPQGKFVRGLESAPFGSSETAS